LVVCHVYPQQFYDIIRLIGALQRLINRSPPLAGHHHIDGTAPALGTDEPLMPIENGSLGAVSPRHFGWRSHLRWLRQELRSGIGTCATFGGTK
jgi:hypothetical protein